MIEQTQQAPQQADIPQPLVDLYTSLEAVRERVAALEAAAPAFGDSVVADAIHAHLYVLRAQYIAGADLLIATVQAATGHAQDDAVQASH